MKRKIKFKLSPEEIKKKQKEAVTTSRKNKEKLGYKYISFQVSPKTYSNLKRIAEEQNITLKEAFERIVNRI